MRLINASYWAEPRLFGDNDLADIRKAVRFPPRGTCRIAIAFGGHGLVQQLSWQDIREAGEDVIEDCVHYGSWGHQIIDRLYNDPARTWPPIVSVIVLPVPQAWEGKDAKCRARHSRVKSPPAAAVGECGMDIGGGAVGGMSGVGGMNGVGMGSGRGLLVDGNGTVGNGTVGEVVSGGGNGVGGARNRTVEGAWRGEVRNMTSALGEGGGGK
ncbi:hypothetical protein MMC21_006597 [Puttea exsequens]|nr:hypothetical protein [Puttea exsequens]